MNCDSINSYHDDDQNGQWAISGTRYRFLNVKCVEQEKIMITCKKLILKEGEGERRTYYDLQTGRFFSGFLGFHFSLDMRPVRR